ncbi:MAG: hypothetical protein NVSMB2_23110 [Chloroflexota bacterium]
MRENVRSGRRVLRRLPDPFMLFARAYEASVPLERDAIQLALELADVRADERLLDVGTGTGALLRDVARRSAQPAATVGIDRCMRMLQATRTGPRPWTVAVGDGRALPLLSDSVDVVSACYVLHLLAVRDRQRVLAEMRRVLRPGGRIVIVTIDAARPGVRWVLSVLPVWTTLRRIDVAAELEAAGLHVVESRYAGAGWPSVCLLAQRRD